MAPTTDKVSHYFPEYLCFSVLSKLPFKSLERFTCARKSWITLCDDSYFMTMFRNSLLSKHNSFYDEDDMCLVLNGKRSIPPFSFRYESYLISGDRFENKFKLDLPPLLQQDDIKYQILCSDGMDGIVCLYNNFDQTTVILWNPTTGEFKIVPPFCVYSKHYVTTLHGFCYDYVKDDYKVICHTCVYYAYETQPADALWHIYSLRKNSWRKLEVEMPPRYISIPGAMVCMNGECHWLGRVGSETHVVSFKSNEEFITTPLPYDILGGFRNQWLGKQFLMMLNGSIALISKHSNATSFDILILGELGVKKSWTKLFIVSPLPYALYPIGTGKKGDIFFRTQDGDLVHFDLRTQAIKECDVKGKFFCSQIAIYKKNLLPIGGINS